VRFLLLIYDDESASDDATPEQFAAMLAQCEAYDTSARSCAGRSGSPSGRQVAWRCAR